MSASARPILAVHDLTVEYATPRGPARAVKGVSFDIHPGETLGIVGESGSGKSVTALSILGLLPRAPGCRVDGRIEFAGNDLLTASRRQLRAIRGNDIAMIFQDPATSLNPVLTIGSQLVESIRTHRPVTRRRARLEARSLLASVGIPSPDRRLDQYAHELSGGMCQRVMIAMAIANEPRVLIADEPTTALDVTIQQQVLGLLRKASRETNAATILITHDLGLIAEMADRVLVMYAGRIVEIASVDDIFHRPRHPYTLGLLASLPRFGPNLVPLEPIPGSPPPPTAAPPGCAFHPRCRLGEGRTDCRTSVPDLRPVGAGQQSACHHANEMADEITRVADAPNATTTHVEHR